MYLFSIIVALLLLVVFLVPLIFWDKGRRSLLLALRSLWLHKLRAFLSVLGIIIGTAAVIALMAFGEGSMHDALEDIKRQGATNIIVRSKKPPDDSASQQTMAFFASYGITAKDVDALESLPHVTRMVGMRIFTQDIRYLSYIHNGRAVATTPDYADIHKLELECGRFLVDDDDHSLDNVAVLGSGVADKLFPFDDPLGQTVRLQQHLYVVVGVLKDRAPLSLGGGGREEDFNNDVYIPLQTGWRRYGSRVYLRQSGTRTGEAVHLNQVTLTVTEMEKVRPIGEMVREIMSRHQKADWEVIVPLDKLELAEAAQKRGQLLLGAIATISLLVGGIGIMNIMLATVTERTREIGIRRALGAKRKDITLQFLVESVVQTAVGGVLGIGIGLGIIFLVPPVYEWICHAMLPARIHVPSIFISLVVSICVGVAFGLYPAMRAAALDPIEALRHE